MAELEALFGSPWGPVFIFVLRIFDVSLATLRVLLAVRGARLAVPVIGFFEVLIWIFAVGSAIQHLDSGWHVLAYAGGFAAGNVVGLWLEEKLAFGIASIRVISRYGGVEMAEALRDMGFGVTEFTGQGKEGAVEVVYLVARRRQVPIILAEVDRWDGEAFVTVETPQQIHRGMMFSKRRK